MKEIQYLPKNYSAAENCLKDKVILVTGAGDGIGRVAALTYAKHGATVVLLGKTQEKLEAVYDEIENNDWPTPALCPFDLSENDPKAYKPIRETIEKNLGHLDGLLHNAGLLGNMSSIESYKPEKWNEVMQVNVNAQFLLTQALLPLMKQSQGASIIFTSSGVGRTGRAHWGAYAVSKFATEGLMECLADELDGIGEVRANALNPGKTRTRMRAQAYPAEDPQTLPSAEDIMPLYLYLMSDDSANINGKSFDAQVY